LEFVCYLMLEFWYLQPKGTSPIWYTQKNEQ
jgi:hypothetical protein